MISPDEALARLAGSEAPFLIGVRHHSPACAAAVPRLLDALRPSRVLVELPAEMTTWLPWLGHATLVAPVALAAVRKDGGSLFFYPFADFSPELAAVRWAVANQIPVEAFDQPYGWSTDREEPVEKRSPRASQGALTAALARAASVEDDVESLWDTLVEARARADSPEATRRAALLFGYALRAEEVEEGGVSARDLSREAYMRACLAARRTERVAAVVGAFHACALLDPPMLADDLPNVTLRPLATQDHVASLVPYAFDLLDSRSGYPAGIRDPMWQARAFEALEGGGDLDSAIADAIVAVVREVRAMGHVAGVPDAKEALRLARDLARLRQLPSPGRRELVESIETCLAQGERLGRGRVLARAMERVLVGTRRGRLPDGAPRSGLAPQVEGLVAALKLPGPGPRKDEPAPIVLDALRSTLDRQRQVALARLAVCGVPYGTLEDRASITSAELLTTRWMVQWTPATEAMLELVGLRGVTLAQAAEGSLRASEHRLRDEDRLTPAARLAGVEAAAECGLPALLASRAEELVPALVASGGLAELMGALALLDRLARGHVAGAPVEAVADIAAFSLPEGARRGELLSAAVAAIEALSGSTKVEDVRALHEMLELYARQRGELDAFGDGRIGFAVDRLASEGSPLMQGAGGAARVLLERDTADALGVRFGSWLDGAIDATSAGALSARLQGALLLATPLFEAHPAFMDALVDRVEALDDGAFLKRLPALRDGFDVLSPAARTRLLDAIAERLGEGPLAVDLVISPVMLADHATADAEGLAALLALGLTPPRDPRNADPERANVAKRGTPEGQLSTRDRFRLLLGRERAQLPARAARYAGALDELYGHGRGEGSRGGGSGGGREAPFPTVREWADELADLFGNQVREEVLGRAASAGRTAAALALDPESVTPSIELLEQVLSLKGGLAERDLERLRRLVQRVVDQLVEALAQRVRPALAGLVTNTSSRRRVGPLDLRRTLSANLRTARLRPDGTHELVPDRLYFRRRARRAMDHHVVLVVDVSGSMEASVIYSAMMAAILSGLPALTVRFVAFNTEVLDLSGRVDDPLGLLLEISVGGGTNIAKGLRYARGLLKVPARSLVLVVSDFEEGESVPAVVAEVRALVESGAKVLGLAALDDRGAPRYHRAIAEQLVAAGMPVAALTPLQLARWVGEQIR